MWTSRASSSSVPTRARAGGGAVDVGEGDGPAERDQRSRGDGVEDLVEGEDLGPVGLLGGGGLVMQGGDRRLDLVRADGGGAQGPVSSARPSAIAAVSHRSRRCSSSGTSDPSRVGAGRAAGVGEQHQREQPGGLAVVGQDARAAAG